MDPFPRRRLVVVLLVLAAGIDLAFWVTWYGHRSWVASSTDPSYADFENAFPLADAWLGGSAGAYLAGMDVLYDVQHGVWWRGGGGVVELGINLISLVGSGFGLVLGWRHRDDLLGRPCD